jgi:hypothetical protein
MSKRTKKPPPKTQDEQIDQASRDSFPASDPPSWTATGSGPASHARQTNGHSHGRFFVDTTRTAAIAAAGSGLVATLIGKRQTGSMAAALNAVSHILWGDRAARTDRFDLAHTGAGTLLHGGAAWLWSAVAHQVWRRSGRGLGAAIAVGAGTAALAYVVDYHVVPKRLTPGFELRVSRLGLFAIYGVLGGALALGLSRAARAG